MLIPNTNIVRPVLISEVENSKQEDEGPDLLSQLLDEFEEFVNSVENPTDILDTTSLANDSFNNSTNASTFGLNDNRVSVIQYTPKIREPEKDTEAVSNDSVVEIFTPNSEEITFDLTSKYCI